MTVLPYKFRDVRLEVEVGIRAPYRQSAALSSTRAALNNILGYNAMPLNLTLRPQDIHAFLTNNVPEIWYATVKMYDGTTAVAPTDVVIANADELIRVLDSNLKITPAAADPGIVNA